VSALIKCPFCPCWFCSQVDLDRHLEFFGVGVDHLKKSVEVHSFDRKLSKFEKRSMFLELRAF
jgi:hypothetical protein